ncbi:MAG: hypothetical protein Q7T41_04605 [Candidatus Saccharibacteria bacterium]|nr:hypothetical protein [Candidatus Saccharibacteria bacterium]
MLSFRKITKKTSRIFASLVLMTAQMTPFFVFGTQQASASDNNIRICHITNNASGPYVSNSVSPSSIDGVGNGDHYLEHKGPIATSVAVAQALKDAHQNWGDIIPPVAPYHTGLNWTATGQAIYNAGCSISTVKVVKNTVPTNDNGLFNLKIEGNTYATNIGNSGNTGEIYVDEDDDITVSETAGTGTQLSNYTTSLVCKNNNGAGDIVESGSPTDNTTRSDTISDNDIDDGDRIVCIFTNTRKSGTLNITKVVVNGDTGTKDVEDFSFSVNGGVAQDFEDDGTNSLTLPVGIYSVTETEEDQDGYETEYSAGCKDVQVVLNQIANCTITNTYQRGRIVVNKTVVNDNGGTLAASDFSVTVDGVTKSFVDTAKDTGSVEFDDLDAGSYTVIEVEEDANGYKTEYSKLCSGSFEVAAGEEVVCEITNDDQPGTLTLVKTVINDNSGENEADDFNLNVMQDDKKTYVKSGVSIILNAGNYKAGEEQLEGYNASDWSGDCDDDGAIMITLGGDFTCYITNDDVSNPSINVEKYGPATAHEGETVTYWFYVTNTGDVSIDGITVDDDIAGEGEYQYGDDEDGVLEEDETWVYSKEYTVQENQDEDVVNTVKVCGFEVEDKIVYDRQSRDSEEDENECDGEEDEDRQEICDTDTHTMDVLHPSINVVKTGPTTAVAGSTVTYTFTVTNTGDVEITDLTAVDSIAGKGIYVSGDTDEDDTLDLDETWIFTVKYTIPSTQTANVVNTVKVCGYESVLEFNDDVSRVLRIVDETDDAVIVEEESTCDEDSHTLKIPQVLGASTTVKSVPKPQVLASTGTNSSVALYLGLVLVLGAVVSVRKTTDK